MASKRIAKYSVDWSDFAKRVSDKERAGYLAFKAKSEGYLRKVQMNPEEVPKIDWSYYKANAANKALVEQFEKAYAITKIPYPDDKGAVTQIDNDAKRLVAKVERFITASNERIKEYEKEIEIIRSTKDYELMSADEFAWYHQDIIYPNYKKPTFPDHVPEHQIPPEDIAYFRKRGWVHGPDEYHP